MISQRLEINIIVLPLSWVLYLLLWDLPFPSRRLNRARNRMKTLNEHRIFSFDQIVIRVLQLVFEGTKNGHKSFYGTSINWEHFL